MYTRVSPPYLIYRVGEFWIRFVEHGDNIQVAVVSGKVHDRLPFLQSTGMD